MKRLKLKKLLFTLAFLLPVIAFGQDLQGEIDDITTDVKLILQALIGLLAIGGGIITYMKFTNGEGEQGKKAVLTYVGGLVFAALMFGIIEFFLG